jgi:thiol-disulfide isomerase/thioredoxin
MKAILTTLFTVLSLGFTAPILKPVQKKLTVYIYNETAYPISVSSTSGFSKLNDFQQIAYKKVDTLQLSVNAYDYVYFSHKNTFGDTLLVAAGDTLRLIAQNETIQSKLRSGTQAIPQFVQALSNYEQRDSVTGLQHQIDSLTKIFYSANPTGKPLLYGNDYQKFSSLPIKINRGAFKTKTATLQLLVNSLIRQYQAKINFLHAQNQTGFKDLYDLARYKTLNELYSQLLMLYNLSQNPDIKSKLSSSLFINNNLIENPFSRAILGSYLGLVLIQKKPDYSKSKVYIDYKEAYANAPKFLSKELTKYARYMSIERMVEGESFLEVEKAYAAFKTQYNDANLNATLEKKYLFDINKYKIIKDNLQLIDGERKIVSFADLLKKEKGKLIYIDFWASWCAPCRAAMPSSMELLNEFKDKNIVFVYFSIDKDTNQWQQAAAAEKLSTYRYSYQIVNTEQSNFLKQIALRDIPRYLLFDQSGKLVHQEAPGPEGDEVRTLIKKYLN